MRGNADLFERARRITATDVALTEGLQLQRGGGKWPYKTCCPLHGEKTASLFFDREGGWHCFGCNQGGRDGTSLFAALRGIGQAEAARQLVGDSSAPICAAKRDEVSRLRSEHKQQKDVEGWLSDARQKEFEKWRAADMTISEVSDVAGTCEDEVNVVFDAYPELEGIFWRAVQAKTEAEYSLDALESAQAVARQN